VKLGLLVESEEGLDWERWRRTLGAAERLGYESVWVSDHLASPWADDRHGIEPWVALSVAAAETAQVRLGSLVSPITFRPPAILARMAESIATLSRDRFVLGVGLGWNDAEHARFGIPFPSVAERTRLLGESISRLQEAGAPLLIGGGGVRSTLPLVARFADAWNLTTSSVDVYLARAERLVDLCAGIGRDPAEIRHSVAAGFLIGRDDAELGARGERLGRLVPPLASTGATQVREAARALGWVAGTPAEIVAALEPLASAGVDLAILGHYDLEDVAALELIAHEVMPALG
jgi:alkanesulfonate monooxygenase SsuD/methylene tetrahydromethanopterin reductase-like flavin-dependent oxidoreductase (luciferase family)